MEVITIQSEAYQSILEDITSIKNAVIANQRINPLSETWLDIQEVCILLKISKRTLQAYRDNGILPFSQIAGKIYFKAEDIDEHLLKHYVKAHPAQK
jgi:excisionase family DNA binding protein